MVEAQEMGNILKRSTKYSLVIGDEMCRGTGYNSSIIITSSMIKIMLEKRVSFISATHI